MELKSLRVINNGRKGYGRPRQYSKEEISQREKDRKQRKEANRKNSYII